MEASRRDFLEYAVGAFFGSLYLINILKGGIDYGLT